MGACQGKLKRPSRQPHQRPSATENKSAPAAVPFPPLVSEKVELWQVAVPQQVIGRIIGRNGSIIRKIGEDSHTHLDIVDLHDAHALTVNNCLLNKVVFIKSAQNASDALLAVCLVLDKLNPGMWNEACLVQGPLSQEFAERMGGAAKTVARTRARIAHWVKRISGSDANVRTYDGIGDVIFQTIGDVLCVRAHMVLLAREVLYLHPSLFTQTIVYFSMYCSSIGALLGERGSNVKDMRDWYPKATLHVPKKAGEDENEEVECVIYGDAWDVGECQTYVERLLDKKQRVQFSPLSVSSAPESAEADIHHLTPAPASSIIPSSGITSEGDSGPSDANLTVEAIIARIKSQQITPRLLMDAHLHTEAQSAQIKDALYEQVVARKMPNAKSVKYLKTHMEALAVAEKRLAKGIAVSEVIFFEGDENDEVRRLVQYIERSTAQIDACVFTITYDLIANAVLDAHKRGVKIRVVTDDEQAKSLGSDIARFAKAGIEVRIDDSKYHMHHKFAIFDRAILATGSFNWTRQASENNEENILISSDPQLVDAYQKQFNKLVARFPKFRY
eukprot:GEMP01016202.1.p1 GENE.GEMP01016202.1~~GEMP01016202.1.p1  ORF type:complete len:560 (+),score=134.99 GEMP01016202.1:31-1710(+)